MKRNTIRLTEGQLRKVIKESVKQVINEMGNEPIFDEKMQRWVEDEINSNCKGEDVHTILNPREWQLMQDTAPDPNVHRFIASNEYGEEIILDCDENNKLIYAEYMGEAY